MWKFTLKNVYEAVYVSKGTNGKKFKSIFRFYIPRLFAYVT